MCTENFTYTKKLYVHEIAAVNLSKIYFLKNAKKTCKPNKRDLNCDWMNGWTLEKYLNGSKKIENTSSHKLLKFIVNGLYPSTNKSLLIKALQFAKQVVTVKAKDGETIFYVVKKSFLHGKP